MAGTGPMRCNRSRWPAGDQADDGMAQGKDRDGGSGEGGRKAGKMALPADLERSMRHLDDAQLDRLLEAAPPRRADAAGWTEGTPGRKPAGSRR